MRRLVLNMVGRGVPDFYKISATTVPSDLSTALVRGNTKNIFPTVLPHRFLGFWDKKPTPKIRRRVSRRNLSPKPQTIIVQNEGFFTFISTVLVCFMLLVMAGEAINQGRKWVNTKYEKYTESRDPPE